MTSRRGKGEGSIYRVADGSWRASLNLGWEAGKRRRRTVSGKTRKEVLERLRALQRDQEAGTLVAPSSQTTGDFLTSWLDNSVHGHLAYNSYEAYRNAVTHLTPHLESIPLQSLTAQHIERAKGSMIREGVSQQSARYFLRVLRIALNRAVRWGLLARNPALMVDLPRVRRKEARAWTQAECLQFLAASKGHRLEHFYAVVLALALRKSEAQALRWQDVDLDKGTVSIRGGLQRNQDGPQLVPAKSDKSVRTLHLPSLARSALESQREAQIPPCEWVFPNTQGKPLHEAVINWEFTQICKRADLPLITVHGLRHTTATLLLGEGIGPHIVSEMLGHSSVIVTLTVYAHVLASMRQDVATAVDGLYG